MIVVCKKNVQLRRRAAPAGRRPIRSTSSGRHGAGTARSQPHQEERVPAARPPGAGRSGRTARASQPAAAHPLLQELASAPALPAPTSALAHPSPTRGSGTSSCTNSVRKKRNQMYLQCYFSHRTLLRDLRWACWLSASVIEASPRTQRPRVDLRHLEDDVPEVAEARPRATSTVLTGNKYRSHDEQVPFSRAISTVLAKEGGDGRGGGRRGTVRKHGLRGAVRKRGQGRGQGRLTAAMTALARPGTAESGRECW